MKDTAYFIVRNFPAILKGWRYDSSGLARQGLPWVPVAKTSNPVRDLCESRDSDRSRGTNESSPALQCRKKSCLVMRPVRDARRFFQRRFRPSLRDGPHVGDLYPALKCRATFGGPQGDLWPKLTFAEVSFRAPASFYLTQGVALG